MSCQEGGNYALLIVEQYLSPVQLESYPREVFWGRLLPWSSWYRRHHRQSIAQNHPILSCVVGILCLYFWHYSHSWFVTGITAQLKSNRKSEIHFDSFFVRTNNVAWSHFARSSVVALQWENRACQTYHTFFFNFWIMIAFLIHEYAHFAREYLCVSTLQVFVWFYNPTRVQGFVSNIQIEVKRKLYQKNKILIWDWSDPLTRNILAWQFRFILIPYVLLEVTHRIEIE